MDSAQIALIKETLGLSTQDLAKALSVAPVTVARWEQGKNTPTGLQAEVLEGLHSVSLGVQRGQDDGQSALLRGLVVLGIGALIFYLLTRTVQDI